MTSPKQTARTAGWLYLALALTGVISVIYVPSVLVVAGNATETAENIRSSEMLFRAGILSGITNNIVFVFLVLTLYRLLNGVNRGLAVLMVALVVVSAAVDFSSMFNRITVLVLLSGADFLSALDKQQQDALAYVFLRSQAYGYQISQIFWGLWLFPFGLLVYMSRFIPKILGVLLMMAGSGYLLSSLTFLLLPQYQAAMLPYFLALELGELATIFWLLIVGVRDQQSDQPQEA